MPNYTQNYQNPSHPTAFGGINQVYNYYRTHHPEYKLSISKIQNILSGVESYTRHKESKSLLRNPTFVYFKRQQIQIDLVDLRHLSASNDNFNYLFNAIDSFTRYAWSIPLKSKTAQETLDAFKLVLDKAKTYPNTVVSDRGSEIRNKFFLCIL